MPMTPTRSLRAGASFIRNGVTRFFVNRLPPGQECANGDVDQAALVASPEAIQRSQELDRHVVRQRASVDFGTLKSVNSVLSTLDTLRPLPSARQRIPIALRKQTSRNLGPGERPLTSRF